MTSKEKELLKSRFQQRWSQAICVQQWAKEGKNGWTKEGAKEFANIACGYMYAIGDALEASMKQSKATDIVRKLNPDCGFVLMDKLEQMDPETLAAFGQWLEGEGLQVIATRVGTDDTCSIIIEDGYIKEDRPQEVPQSAPKAETPKWTPGTF